MNFYLGRQVKIKRIGDEDLYYRAYYDREDGSYAICFWTEKKDDEGEGCEGVLIDPAVGYWDFYTSSGYSDDELVEAWTAGRLHELIQTDVDKRADELGGDMPPEIWEAVKPILTEFFEVNQRVVAGWIDEKRKKEAIEGPKDKLDLTDFSFGITGPSFDMFSTGGAKEPVKKSAAFFDDDIDCAKTVETLDQIAAELETGYVGAEDNRQRLLKRIEAERARMTGETPEDQEPRVMETKTSPGAILEELAPLFPYGGIGAKIIVDQNNMTEHVYNADVRCVLEIRWRETGSNEKATEVYSAIANMPGISRLDWEYNQH